MHVVEIQNQSNNGGDAWCIHDSVSAFRFQVVVVLMGLLDAYVCLGFGGWSYRTKSASSLSLASAYSCGRTQAQQRQVYLGQSHRGHWQRLNR